MRNLSLQRNRSMSCPPWRGMLSVLALVFGGFLLAPATASAQHPHGVAARPIGSDSHESVPHTVSAKAREQIAAVESAVTALKTQDSASAAGFMPHLGMIPTMGEHWLNPARVFDEVNVLKPDVLMFSLVGGERRLVGVAYAFLGQLSDAPDLFDGEEDVWHEHPEFAPPGQSLVMLHVWFVPSPDGAFAGHNPWLAYWAAGAEPPADSLMSEPASAPRMRRLALALAEAVEPMALAQVRSEMAMSPPSELKPPPNVGPLRDSLRMVIPRLNAARRAGDRVSWDHEADAAIALWEQVRNAYLEAIPVAELRQQVAAFYQEMETGAHGQTQALSTPCSIKAPLCASPRL